MSTDVLQEVEEKCIPKLLEVLKKDRDWTEHFVLYQLMSVMEVYKKTNRNSAFKYRIYLHGNVNVGVYMCRVTMELPDGEKDIFFVYTSDPDLSTFRCVLSETRVIPWQKRGFQFVMVHARLYQVVQQVFEAKSVEFKAIPNNILWLPPQIHLLPRALPEDVYLDFLRESHVSQVDAEWPHRFPGSHMLIREHILTNFGLGLFRKSDDRMLSSSVSNYTGGIFILHTDPEFRGRGYAEIIVEQMVREIQQRDWIPFCTVVIGNTPSEKLFKKCGFEQFTKSTWMISKS